MEAAIPAIITGVVALLALWWQGFNQKKKDIETKNHETNVTEVRARIDSTEQVLLAWQAYASAQNDQISHLITRLEENEVRLRQSEERSAKCEAEKNEIRGKFMELELRLARANLLPEPPKEK